LAASCQQFCSALARQRRYVLAKVGFSTVDIGLSLTDASWLMWWGGQFWAVETQDSTTALVHRPTGALVVFYHRSPGWMFFRVGQRVGRPWMPGDDSIEPPPPQTLREYDALGARATRSLLDLPRRTGNWLWRWSQGGVDELDIQGPALEIMGNRSYVVVWNTDPSATGEVVRFSGMGFDYITASRATWHDGDRLFFGSREDCRRYWSQGGKRYW